MLAETSVREEIEERFLSFRDLFAALFFFVFGLTIDVGALRDIGWLVGLAVVLASSGSSAPARWPASLAASRAGRA